MNELEQWCEIDGHDYVFLYYYYGLILGPKTETVIKICNKCKKSEYSSKEILYIKPITIYPKLF